MGEGGELGEEMDGTKRMVGREGGGGGFRGAWEWEEENGWDFEWRFHHISAGVNMFPWKSQSIRNIQNQCPSTIGMLITRQLLLAFLMLKTSHATTEMIIKRITQ